MVKIFAKIHDVDICVALIEVLVLIQLLFGNVLTHLHF